MAGPERLYPVLIVGSTGAFGSRVAELLCRSDAFDVVLAGRTAATLRTQADDLALKSGRRVRHTVLDAETVQASAISALGVSLVINASGPFQTGSYALARACIEAKCHYADLADARAFVTGIGTLDAAARAADVLVVSGASSVPGLSSAVVQQHRDAFAGLFVIDVAISPGNAFDPGRATVHSVLDGLGRPIRVFEDGAWRTVYGWQGLRRGTFGAAGQRWLGNVDVPDLGLYPQHFASLKTARFQAGLEVGAFHIGLWAASWLVRWGLVASLAPLAGVLLAIKRKLHWLGSDRGGMTVTLSGLGRDARPTTMSWTLVARDGDGPYVPALSSVALARRLATGAETRRGALPCHGILRLDAILAEAEGLAIETVVK